MKKIFFTILISLFITSAFAQFNENDKALADKAFNNKDYYEAAFYYKKIATGMNLVPQQPEVPFRSNGKPSKTAKTFDQAYVSYQLAESYRLYENYLEAEGWYFKVIEGNNAQKYPLVRLWYGICLRANQHFDEAIKQLEQFKTEYKGTNTYTAIADKELANCHFAKEQYQYPALIEVVKMKGVINSDGSDYSLIINNGKRWFTSSRIIKDDKKHLNRVYALRDTNTPVMISFNNSDNKKEVEYGTPSIDPTGKRMYLTRWYKEGAKTIHAIYISTLTNNEWATPVKLNGNINADGYNSVQPFITADGKRLFFASNKPGGQGGDDIWVSDLDADGNPTNSTNLGSTINTPLDEQAPYYDAANKQLIYSSKGFVGLGGFDFFISYENMGQWSTPKNMGYPMNSAKDDLYYFPDNNNGKNFYLSSDRASDCCLDLFEAHDKKYILTGIVTDCDTHAPLPGVKVSFVDSLSKQVLKSMVVGDDAKYTFTVTTKRPYNMVLEKKNYFTKVLPAPSEGKMSNDMLYSPDICLKIIKPNVPIVIPNILYDFNKATLRPRSKVILDSLVKVMEDNPQITKVRLSAHTDSIGGEAYNMKLSQARAQACVDYMVSKGISDTKIEAKGYGKSSPIAPNSLPNGKDNPEGRQLNRRTEFTVLKTE